MGKDYYKVLGIDKDADAAGVKKAFRNQAKKHHPDKGGDPEVFKSINEAYETLSDTEKRSTYDRFGSDMKGANQFNTGQSHPFNNAGFDMSDIFDHFGFGGQQKNKIKKGGSLQIRIQVTLEEILSGFTKKIKINKNIKCETCAGKGGKNPRTCMNCGGTGEKVHTTRTVFGVQSIMSECKSCHGDGEVISDRCGGCGGNGFKKGEDVLDIKVPSGVYHGLSFVQEGKGNYIRNGVPGDLQIVIEELPHKKFVRDGIHLHMIQEISVPDAILGAEMIVSTLDKSFSIKIDKGVQNGKIYRMSGRGLPALQNNNRRGDLYIEVSIKIPTTLTHEEEEIIKKLKNSNNFKL